MKRRASSIN